MRFIKSALLVIGMLFFALFAMMSFIGGRPGDAVFLGLLAAACGVGWGAMCKEAGVSPGKTILLTLLACIGLGFVMGGDD